MIKKILIGVTLSLILLLPVACRNAMPGNGGTDSSVGTTTPASTTQAAGQEAEEVSNDEAIQLRLLVSEYHTAAYRSLVSRFEEENPDIQVELVTQSQILSAEEGTTFAPEETPRRKAAGADVITTGTGRLDVSQGLRLDLTPFIEADSTFDENDFYPGLLDQYRWDGGIWAVPVSATFELLVFNKDLFDEAGYPYPEPGWSWADFLDTALALTERGQTNETTQWGYVDWTIGQVLLPQSLTGPLLDASTTPPQPRLNHPQFISGVKWYSDLFLVHQVAPVPRTQEELDSFWTRADTLIKQGQAAMWKQRVSLLLTGNQEDNLGFVPLPEGTVIRTGSMAISAGTRHPAAAWRLLSFLNQQMHRDITGAPAGAPARRSVAAASGFFEEIDEGLTTAIEYALAHALPPSNEFGVGPVSSAFTEALQQILVGRLSVAEAMAQAQVQAEAGLADALLARENATPPPPLSVAPADTPPAQAADSTPITFAPLGEPFNWQMYRDLVPQFMEANPGLVIEIEPSSPYAAPTTFAGVAANADCFEWVSSIDRGATETAVLSLDPFFDADPALAPAHFFDAGLAPFMAPEQLLGLPAAINTAVIAYNRDLFAEAGLAPPAGDWTIDDFQQTAVALTQGTGEDKQYGYVPPQFETLDFINMVRWLGAPLLDDDGQPPALHFTDAATVAAVRRYTDLTTVHDVKPVFIDQQGETDRSANAERQRLIESGRAVMWLHQAAADGVPATVADSTGFAPLPAGADGSRHSVGGYQTVRGYFISAATEKRQACWQWLTFLTQQPTVATESGALPARPALAEAVVSQQTTNDRLNAVLYSVRTTTPSASPLNFLRQNTWLNAYVPLLEQVYVRVLFDGVPVEDALAEAQATADAYRDCLIERDTFTDPASQQTCRAVLQRP